MANIFRSVGFSTIALTALALALFPSSIGFAAETAPPPEESVEEAQKADQKAIREELARQKVEEARKTKESEKAKRSKVLGEAKKHLKIEEKTPLPPPLPNGQNKSGVSSNAISVPKGPNSIEGMGESFSTQPSTGVATFSIPIALPKARGGAQPSLTLAYSSASGSGLAGVGWDIGVAFIQRQTDRGVPTYDDRSSFHPNQDRFVFGGGQELVPVSMAAAQNGEQFPDWSKTGWQYFRSRVEGSYLRFFWNPQQQLWRVQDKAGIVLELGGQDAVERDPDNPAHVFRWYVTRQIDGRGNEVRYQYQQNGGLLYVSDIFDTSPVISGKPWAHHVHLWYETRSDRSTSWLAGWKTARTLRIRAIDVTSIRTGESAARELLRRYTMTYDSASHASLLRSVQVMGRCKDNNPVESSNDLLPQQINCPTLPPMEFEYSTSAGTIPATGGYPAYSKQAELLLQSPPASIGNGITELFDINSDGLPDVVTMDPGQYRGNHGLFILGDRGNGSSFQAAKDMRVFGLGGSNAGNLNIENPNILAMDVDSDGNANLVHMPGFDAYWIYQPTPVGAGWSWQGRQIDLVAGNRGKIDLGSDAVASRVMDVNHDGLVDVVQSAGDRLKIWYSLGRYPGGKDQFGFANWTGAASAQVHPQWVERCAPMVGAAALDLSSSEVHIADMNGDGLPDIVWARPEDVRYWPGRGDGYFGTGALGCTESARQGRRDLSLGPIPNWPGPMDDSATLVDVTGDGLSDVVRVGSLGSTSVVSIWINDNGERFLPRVILEDTPALNALYKSVRITDINGNGTPDILWGNATRYRYVDLYGKRTPNLLTVIRNGLGKRTEIEYTTSVQEMLAAEAASAPWERKMPIVVHMVKRTTVRDGLSAVGMAEGQYVTEYTYRDPTYDGRQREFRGFKEAEVKTLGDDNSPTSVSWSTFDMGESPAAAELWEDNPNECMKGNPLVSETFDEGRRIYTGTNWHSYEKRKLYDGLDGRGVWVAFAKSSESYVYSTAEFQLAYSGKQDPTNVRPRSTVNTKHTKSEVDQDAFGNKLWERNHGFVGEDSPITAYTVPMPIATPNHPLGDGRWSWRTVRSYVVGADKTPRKETQVEYNAWGEPTVNRVVLSGSVPVKRGTTKRFANGSAITPAPVPTTAVRDGVIEVSRTFYDSYGNAAATVAAGDRCADIAYDPEYAQLPVEEGVWVGNRATVQLAGNSARCGVRRLRARAYYDRGLQAPELVVTVNNEATKIAYDTFGRTEAIHAPNPALPGVPQAVASLMVEYRMGNPVSHLVSRKQIGANTDSTQYQAAYAYIDGLGRTILTLSQADKGHDKSQWIVEGMTDYDQKGAARRKYMPWGYDGDPLRATLAPPAGIKYGLQRYDAFGRVTVSYGLDGAVTLRTRYRGACADAWDAEDIGPGEHAGTYPSECKDGFGRTKQSVARIRVNGTVEEHYVEPVYGPTGDLLAINRRRGNEVVARTMTYDSLGRMVTNTTPETGTWIYAYDNAGEIVATSDARGCGVNYEYDAAGRIVKEDYSPCEPHHSPYNADPEVFYLYDYIEPTTATSAFPDGMRTDNLLGRLSYQRDRGTTTVFSYDGRGRIDKIAKAIRRPAGGVFGQWFRKEVKFDAADRVVEETMGDRIGSTVNPEYGMSGRVIRVDSSFGNLVQRIMRAPDGLVTDLIYGDAANTTTSTTYDDLRRPRTITTYRARPQIWGTSPTADAIRSQQMLLQDEQFTYDRVGNPTEIRDWRDPSEWPDGSKPATRKMKYDDFYRLTRVDYQYAGGSDKWLDPYAKEHKPTNASRGFLPIADMTNAGRPQWQTWAFDWLGNITDTDDNAHAFWDRSVGKQDHNRTKKYQLQSANNTGRTGGRNGTVAVNYDSAGYMTQVRMTRAGPCLPAGGLCAYHQYNYYWDEVGNLVRAKRFLAATETPDTTPSQVNMDFAYDSGGNRVRKSLWSSHTVYVFPSLELRWTTWNETDRRFEVTDATESAYLIAHGVKLGRVAYIQGPTGARTARVFLELGDHLGSTAVVLDRLTGELVERSTTYAYGATESDYRPERWEEFREQYKFTGKEEDIELGITYFGKRYYSPYLGRWLSADPLAVHEPGQADLNLYAYVSGKVFVAVDPTGLQEAPVQKLPNYTEGERDIHTIPASSGTPTFNTLQHAEQKKTPEPAPVTGLVCPPGYAPPITNYLPPGTAPNTPNTPQTQPPPTVGPSGGSSAWASIGRFLKSAPVRISAVIIACGALFRGDVGIQYLPPDYQTPRQKGEGCPKPLPYQEARYYYGFPGYQQHHLNQFQAYKSKIPHDWGFSVPVTGSVNQVGSQHNVIHVTLEKFWNQYRGTELRPTNAEYGAALESALRNAGVSPLCVLVYGAIARWERALYGLEENAPVPEVPNPITSITKQVNTP